MYQCPGDKVLITQQKTGLEPPFDPKSYTVIGVKGTQVTAIRGSKRRVRNMAKCKLLHRRPKHLAKDITENPSGDEFTDSDTIDLTLRQEPRNPHMVDHHTEPQRGVPADVIVNKQKHNNQSRDNYRHFSSRICIQPK